MCENCPFYSKCMDSVDACACISSYEEVYDEPCPVVKELCE